MEVKLTNANYFYHDNSTVTVNIEGEKWMKCVVYDNHHHLDLNIYGSDGFIPAHKVVFASVSRFLREIFNEHENVSLILPDFTRADLEKMVQFFYTGRFNFGDENVEVLAVIDDLLGLKGTAQSFKHKHDTFMESVVKKSPKKVPAKKKIPAKKVPEKKVSATTNMPITPSQPPTAAENMRQNINDSYQTIILKPALTEMKNSPINKPGISVSKKLSSFIETTSGIQNTDKYKFTMLKKPQVKLKRLDHTYNHNGNLLPSTGTVALKARSSIKKTARPPTKKLPDLSKKGKSKPSTVSDGEKHLQITDMVQPIVDNSEIPLQKHQCPIKYCKRVFSGPGEFKVHIQEHQKQNIEYTDLCPICNKIICTLHSLPAHMKSHITEEGVINKGCPRCSHEFESIPEAFVHRDSHRGRSKVICPLRCSDKEFQCTTDILNHLSLHLDLTVVYCKWCIKSFSTRPQFFEHVKICTAAVKSQNQSVRYLLDQATLQTTRDEQTLA